MYDINLQSNDQKLTKMGSVGDKKSNNQILKKNMNQASKMKNATKV